MRATKFLIALAVLLMAGGTAFAGLQIGSDGVRGDSNQVLTSVYNNSASNLTSGTVVIWDTALSGDANEGAYVNTTTSADSNLVAGVVVSDTILAGGVGTICVRGPVYALYANSTDGSTDTVGTAIGTTTVAGQFGNGSGLGCILQVPADGDTADRARVLIFVNPSNAE